MVSCLWRIAFSRPERGIFAGIFWAFGYSCAISWRFIFTVHTSEFPKWVRSWSERSCAPHSPKSGLQWVLNNYLLFVSRLGSSSFPSSSCSSSSSSSSSCHLKIHGSRQNLKCFWIVIWYRESLEGIHELPGLLLWFMSEQTSQGFRLPSLSRLCYTSLSSIFTLSGLVYAGGTLSVKGCF